MGKCRLCNGENISIIKKGTRDRADIDVCRCEDCGLVFLSEVAVDDSFYMDSQMRGNIDFNRWRQNTYVDDRRRFRNYQKRINGKRILDFGCGNGGFLKLVIEEGNAARAVGVDLDGESVRRLVSEGILCHRSVKEMQGERFDMVFMFHVVEHLPNPENILNMIAGYMEEGGIMVLETPNADDALLNIYHCEKFADFTYWSPHIFLYNESTLTRMLKGAGFTVERIVQEQRYPLANHLRWLAKGLPGGGVVEFQELDDLELNAAYARVLGQQKACDTLICEAGRA